MNARNVLLALALPCTLPLAAPPAAAQVPSVLLREGGSIPGGAPGETVGRFFGVAQAADGGWATVLDAAPASGPWVVKVVGDPDGSGATLLHEPGLVGGVVHERLSVGLGVGGGAVHYEACVPQTTTTNCYIEVWDGAVPVLAPSVPGTLIDPFGPNLIRTSADGRPAYTDDLGLYVGDLSNPLFVPGQSVPNLTGTLPFLFANGIVVSPSGDHFVARAELQCPTCAFTQTVLIDGQAIEFAGVPFRSGDTLPPSIGTPIDRWREARRVAVNDAGDWAIEGRILRAPVAPEDEYIGRNGEIFLRSGDAIADGSWVDALEIFLAGDGRLFHVSRYLDAAGQAQQGIFVERALIYRFGDPVDATGSGAPDPGFSLLAFNNFFAQRAFTVAEDGTVLFFGSLLTPNSITRTALVELRAGGDRVYVGSDCASTPNSTAETSALDATQIDLAQRSLTLVASQMPANQFGFIVTSLDADFTPNPGGSEGNLCLGGAIGRSVGGVIPSTGAGGTFSVPVDLDFLPSPSSIVAVLPGETRYFQAWHRDLSGGGAQTSNFSNGLRLVFP